MAELPILAAYVPDREARAALKQVECDLVLLSSRQRVLSGDQQRPPRLVLLQATGEQTEETRLTLEQLRRERPLIDLLVWAPAARGGAVREFFLAGAKDVVVSRSSQKLVDACEQVLARQKLLPRLHELSRSRSKSSKFESMFSRSESMWDLFELCDRIAPSDATVLIIGETGTGKELLARAVHRRSQRTGRFVAANCASIPSELINSELFGHEKGAFTGADRAKTGLVAHANQGTLFLDEIGDMPPEAQQSLLRMLQERRVRRVGGLKEEEVDVRVVAATNVPLDQSVAKGEFREDLFYRLDVIRMNVPPLRERPEDILFLFGHFTRRLSKHYGLDPPTFADSFLDALLSHDWPGNVRQLENFSERMVLARPQRALNGRDFSKLRSSSLADQPARQSRFPAFEPIDTTKPLQDHLQPLIERQEREYLKQVLSQNRGRIGESAAQAGVNRRTLLRKMKLYGLEKSSFKS